jgi:hypothetical protein
MKKKPVERLKEKGLNTEEKLWEAKGQIYLRVLCKDKERGTLSTGIKLSVGVMCYPRLSCLRVILFLVRKIFH